MEDSQLPAPFAPLFVDTTGAEIIDAETGSGSDDPGLLLPNHEELISHIALDIGGTLAKVVYFTRAPPKSSSTTTPAPRAPSPPDSPARSNGILGPKSLSQRPYAPPSHRPTDASAVASTSTATAPTAPASPSPSGYPPFQKRSARRSSTSNIPAGGRLNFAKFQTTDLSSCISFLSDLIERSAASNRVPLDVMKKNVKIMATGGGAHKFYARLREELGVEVRREEEMECLVLGLGFVMEIPNEVFWYSDELVQAISHPHQSPSQTSVLSMPDNVFPALDPTDPFPRPSPNPPQYSLSFDARPTPAQFPCLLVNIGSGVSIIKVDDYGKFERISGTSLGGGTLWGLLSLLTGAKSFDDMLSLADKGDNSSVDMLVGDIYGQDYQKIGLKSSTIASSFGKVFLETGEVAEDGKKAFKPEDISRSLLYAISNNIGQIAYMNAEKHNLDRIYFGGGFIRGHAATISTLSYAIRFWSKGTKRALFLRHEGYLGGIGAWLKNLSDGADTPRRPNGERDRPLGPFPPDVGVTSVLPETTLQA
ncbi:hypothetical protein RQP46_003937 [Phenoliferia psychrophenolica]